MKIKIIFLSFIGVILISCSPKVGYHNKIPVLHNVYNQYCFASGFCTDTLFIRFVDSFGNSFPQQYTQDTIYTKKNIKPLDVNNQNDLEIIEQFLLSLEAYNYYALGAESKRPVIWTQYAFFYNPEKMKNKYVSKVHGSTFELYNLNQLKQYDFKYQFTEKRDSIADRVTVSFDNYDTYFICSMQLFDQIIFQRYLNYISKNHRISPYVLGIKPIQWINK